VQPDLTVSVQENTDVASARRIAAAMASKLRFTDEEAGVLAVIVTEAASNIVKHGGGGEMIVRDISSSGHPLIEIIAIDRGKGMNSVARCFEDGYSTGNSPGTGLGAVARLAKYHEVYSAAEQGTVLLAHVGTKNRAGAGCDGGDRLQIGAISLPYPGEEVCGDTWAYSEAPERARFVVADGLGHGAFAAAASAAAAQLTHDPGYLQPRDLIESAHIKLKSTRGAAIAAVDVDFRAGTVKFCGVGNVVGAIVSPLGIKRQMVSINGTLGHEMRKARQYDYPLEPGSLLIIHSDGLGANWTLDKYPGLFQRHAGVIAGILFRDFRRIRDDATVVVARALGAAA